MTGRTFLELDVFSAARGCGNPLGVVLEANDLDTGAMQRLAAWLNLSETTFVLPATDPGADYRLRIFTPRQELPFAGHPSVGTAHAVLMHALARPRDGRLVQQCEAGLLPIRVEGSGDGRRLHVRAPRAVERSGDPADALASLQTDRLGSLRPALIHNGPSWWCVELTDETAVRTLAPDLDRVARAGVATGAIGVAVFAHCVDQPYQLVVRAFAPGDGVPEDPVTGSVNACIAAWLHRNGAAPARQYVSSQGREVGRDGFVEISIDEDDEVWIGGRTQTVVEGTVHW
jgi:PhzF family phenazine biosynthesis protein